jgi:hypothetical protein
MLDFLQTKNTARDTICGISCIVSSLHIAHHILYRKYSFFLIFLLSCTRWLSSSRPIRELLFWTSWVIFSPFLVTFKSGFLNGEHVSISDGLADVPLLMMAALAVGRGKTLEEKLLLFPPAVHCPRMAKYSWGYSKMYCHLLLSSR